MSDPSELDRLDETVKNARVVVCVGPGGVGKTSSSAAIAMQGAVTGRRTMVLTIDPAKRLANAMGLPEIGNEEGEVDAAAFEAMGLPRPEGRMTAMMLDIKRAWDDVLMRYHPDAEGRDKLLKNRLYVALSTALAGSQEYMAMEKLYDLAGRKTDPLDLIVLDTPPATQVVDFLEAPSRVLNALDNDATRWLLEPYLSKGGITQKLFDAGASFFLRTISRFTGAELLHELAEFLAGFQGMFDGFRDRAEAVRQILEAEDTTFFVVSTPGSSAIADAAVFRERLLERGTNVGAVVLNRSTPHTAVRAEGDDRVLEQVIVEGGGTDALAERLIDLTRATAQAAENQQKMALELKEQISPTPVVLVPELPRDIHDLSGLDALRQRLFE